MPKEVHRQRIEKYLDAHGVSIEEYALMYLTRQLSDKSPQDAREILKTIIIKTKNTGILQTDDIKGEFAHSKATQPVALTPAPYLDRLPSSGKDDISAEVNDEPKKEERDNKIIRYYLSALLFLCLIVGLLFWPIP
ncbi:hypothetical protein [Alteromonas lipotrueae]|uniref:hypothetical protein n=1 Tax=Alteromonas lipotrueae TaxID=2803814 RepID=UPI001C4629FC|nr:hypothetical protein [Alteromonas lipotrueae]